MSETIHARFFEESLEQSQIKAEIVAKYFWGWAKMMMPVAKRRGIDKIAYVDLFAGPGRDKDGARRAPLLVLEKALADPNMCRMLVSIFNDADADHTRSLDRAIQELPGIEKLKYQPEVHSEEVGAEIAKRLEAVNPVPTLLFIDPWGYKGLSLQLINSMLQHRECDCILFFNYRRINLGLNNMGVIDHMNSLFGEARASKLREKLDGMSPEDRELEIVEAIAAALQEMGGKFVLPFRFLAADGNRTSHHLMFVSKHVLGYTIMKRIMAKECDKDGQGVPSFEYSPATTRQPLLFQLTRSLDDLEQMLLTHFAGRTLSVNEVYRLHHVGTPYVKQNYKSVLTRLEAARKIKMKPPAAKRQKRKGKTTCANHVKVIFPARH